MVKRSGLLRQASDLDLVNLIPVEYDRLPGGINPSKAIGLAFALWIGLSGLTTLGARAETAAHPLLAAAPASQLHRKQTPIATGFSPILTQVKLVRQLSPEQAAHSVPVRLTGAVMDLSGWKNSFFFQDASGGISIDRTDTADVHVGDQVEVIGTSNPGLFAPIVLASSVTVVGHAPPAPAHRVTLDEMVGGSQDSQWVEVQGVVHSVWTSKLFGHDTLYLKLDLGGGSVNILLQDFAGFDSSRLVDSTVRIRGVCATDFNGKKQFVGLNLFVPSRKDVEILQLADADPFAAPATSVRNALQFGETPHRVKVTGIATYQIADRALYIQDGTDGIRIQTSSHLAVEPGRRVEAVGFPVMGEYAPILEDGIFRVLGPAALIVPARIVAKDAIVHQAGFVDVPHDQQLVQIEGRVEEHHIQGGQRVWILREGSEVFEAYLPLSAPLAHEQDLGGGSILLLTGICTAQTDSDRKPISFGILLRSSTDIVVLQHPSWWTTAHSLFVLGTICAVAIFVILWVFLLKHRAEQRKYRGIFDSAIVGIFQVSPSGAFVSVNPAMATTCGYSSPQDMISCVKSGQLFVDPNRREEYESTLSKVGSTQDFEYEIFRKDGKRIWVSTSVRAIFGKQAVIRYEGMSEDVTERKLLQDRLLQAQKLESVGQLAAGVAHEINTPMQFIGDNVRFLKNGFQDLTNLLAIYDGLLSAATADSLTRSLVDEVGAAVKSADLEYLLEETPKAVDETLEGIARVAALVGAMKEFAHPGTKEKVPLDLNHAIQSTITVARNEWKYVAELEPELDPSIPMISCQPGEFNQVVLNLIVNAAHAIADRTGNGNAGKGAIKVKTVNRPAWVEIRVQDTGSGIPEKIRSRIFDPFFTTKEIGKGSGQGLAIARSVIVDRHGGSIDFQTQEGVGTTFVILLPHDGTILASKSTSA